MPTPRGTSVEIALMAVERLYIFRNATLRGTSVQLHGNPRRKNPRRSRHYHKRSKPSAVVNHISDPVVSSNSDCNSGQLFPNGSAGRVSQQIVFRCHCRNSRRWSIYRNLTGRFTLPSRTPNDNATIHQTTTTSPANGLSRGEPCSLPRAQHPNDAAPIRCTICVSKIRRPWKCSRIRFQWYYHPNPRFTYARRQSRA